MNTFYESTSVSHELAERLNRMPKVELHVHLEGATEPATIWELAQRNHVTLPASTLEDWQSMYSFRDFDHFMDIYMLAASCMQTPDDFVLITERFLQSRAQCNIKYSEVFLSATLMLAKLPADELIAAFAEGARQSETRYGTRLHFIPDITRHMPESRRQVLDFVLKGREQGIFIGLGLGGKEVGYPPELFVDVFSEARRQDLHVVAHAGETEGPRSIWGALDSLHAERIGHGVRAIEDPYLVSELYRKQVPLEISPHSNYCLELVPSERPHPIRFFMENGVCVTLNTDDPSFFSTDLNKEYLLLAAQGFAYEELWKINLNALNASFLSENEKARLQYEWYEFDP